MAVTAAAHPHRKEHPMTDQDGWNRHYEDGDKWRPVTTAEVTALAEHLDPVPPGTRALDVGCGTGEYAASLHQLGYQVDGIDWAPAAIERARTLEQPGLRFHCTTLDDPVLEPGYRLVTARLVYPVIDDRQALLDTAARLLASGGHLAVTAQPVGDVPASRRHIGLDEQHLTELTAWAHTVSRYEHDGLLTVLCTRPEGSS